MLLPVAGGVLPSALSLRLWPRPWSASDLIIVMVAFSRSASRAFFSALLRQISGALGTGLP